MGLPSKKRTPRSRDERRSHFALKQVSTKKCTKCNSPVLAHRACPDCGTYRGRDVVDTKKRAARRAKRVTQ